MIALKIILYIILALIVFILFLQIQIRFDYDQMVSIFLKILFFKIQILPKSSKRVKTKKDKKVKKQNKEAQEEADKKEHNKSKPKLTIDDILDAIPYVYDSIKQALRATGKRLRFDPFTLNVCFAGDDPAQVAKNYGTASTVMWTIMPDLENKVHIPNPKIHLDVNYQDSTITITCSFGLKIRIIDLLHIGICALIPIIKLLIKLKKKKNNKNNNKTEE